MTAPVDHQTGSYPYLQAGYSWPAPGSGCLTLKNLEGNVCTSTVPEVTPVMQSVRRSSNYLVVSVEHSREGRECGA